MDYNEIVFALFAGVLLNVYGIWLLRRSKHQLDSGELKKAKWSLGVGVFDIFIGTFFLINLIVNMLTKG